MTYDCAIIGAGPAGIAAALQLGRAGARIALFERKEVGGLLRNAFCVENYLGFPGGIEGKELAALFGRQLRDLGIERLHEDVLVVEEDATTLLLRTAKRTHRCKRVIIATGTVPRRAGIVGEERWAGSRLFYEVSDMPEEGRGRLVLVVGGGDIGFDSALHLHERGYKPMIVTRGEPRCLALLRGRAAERGIRCIGQSRPRAIREVAGLLEVALDGERVLADYLLVVAGRTPSSPRVDAKSRGAVLYAGDVRNGLKRHVHIAAGDGLRAALRVLRQLPSPS